MLGRLYEGQDCSAARGLELIGERWSLLILRDAIFRRFTRFSEFERSLGIAPNVLAKRLDGFVEAGLMERPEGDKGDRRYLLTERGWDLKTVLIALTTWGDSWVSPGPVDFVDSRTGAMVLPRLVDVVTGEAVDPTHVEVRLRTER